MLDQNTDRMWYVIGAVLVGAAIILIANGTLPQMFASVSENFNEVSLTAQSGIESIGKDRNYFSVNRYTERHISGFDVYDFYIPRLKPNTEYILATNAPNENTLYFDGLSSRELHRTHKENYNIKKSDSQGRLKVYVVKGRGNTDEIMNGEYWVSLVEGTEALILE